MERKERAIKGIENWINFCREQRIFGKNSEKELIEKLATIQNDLEKPMMVLITGEFNAGKSTFINALIGDKVLVSDITPATAIITKLTYGPKRKLFVHFRDKTIKECQFSLLSQLTAEKGRNGDVMRFDIEVVELQLPVDLLKSYTLIDSPGLTSLHQEHSIVTEKFLKEADAAIWLFNSMNVGTAAEVAWLKKLNDFKIPVRGLVNGIDRIDEEEDLDVFYQYNERRLAPYITRLTGISARDLLAGKMTKNTELIEWGNQAAVEELFSEFLDEKMEYFYQQIKLPLQSYQNLLLRNIEPLKYMYFRKELIASLEQEGSLLLKIGESILLEKKILDKRMEEWNSKLSDSSWNLQGIHSFVQQFEDNQSIKRKWRLLVEPKLQHFTDRLDSIKSQARKLELHGILKDESYKKIDRVFLKLFQTMNYFKAEQEYNEQLEELQINLEFFENDYGELELAFQTFKQELEMVIEKEMQPLKDKLNQLLEVWNLHIGSFQEGGLKWKAEESQRMEMYFQKFSLFKEYILSLLNNGEEDIRTDSHQQIHAVLQNLSDIHMNYQRSDVLEIYLNVSSLELTKEKKPIINMNALNKGVAKYSAYSKAVHSKLNRTEHFKDLGPHLLKEPGIAGVILAILSTLF